MTLFEAVANQDLDALREQLDAGAHPDPFDAEQQTPLMRAAFAGHRKMVEALLAAGADPILRDGQHETPLLKAAAAGHPELMRLLSKGATEDDLALARTLLAHPPELLAAGPPEEPADDTWSRRFASAGAWVSDKLGDEDPKKRIERLDRAEKKKR